MDTKLPWLALWTTIGMSFDTIVPVLLPHVVIPHIAIVHKVTLLYCTCHFVVDSKPRGGKANLRLFIEVVVRVM